MNKEALIGNLHNVLDQLNAQLDALNEEAVLTRIRPIDLQDHHGQPVMLPVLCAKAQVLSSIAMMAVSIDMPEVIILDGAELEVFRTFETRDEYENFVESDVCGDDDPNVPEKSSPCVRDKDHGGVHRDDKGGEWLL